MSLRATLDGVEVVYADSLEADFSEMTWTLRLTAPEWAVRAGCHAIMRSEDYRRMEKRLEAATRILRALCDTENEKTVGAKNYEAIQAFFDPEPLA